MTQSTTMVKIFVAILGIFLTDNVSEISASGWSYDDEAHWGAVCQEGRLQSPIRLSKDSSKKANYPQFVMEGYDDELAAVIKNNGHSVEIRPVAEGHSKPEIQGGGFAMTYQLDSFHFHWQSEHVMENTRYPVELHFVHFAKDYKNLSNALQYPGGVAVLAVFGHLSPDEDAGFNPLIQMVHNVKDAVNTAIQIPQITVKDFLPRDMGGFFRYEGSLTTPGCNEGVVWTVFTESIPISRNQVKIFEEVRTELDVPLVKNYRTLQGHNSRTIYLKESHIPLPSHLQNLSHGNVNEISFVALLISLLAYLSLR